MPPFFHMLSRLSMDERQLAGAWYLRMAAKGVRKRVRAGCRAGVSPRCGCFASEAVLAALL